MVYYVANVKNQNGMRLKMIDFFGLFGMLLVLLAFGLTLLKNGNKYFYPLQVVGSGCLLIHSLIVKDIFFIVVQLLITIISGYNTCKEVERWQKKQLKK